MNHLGGYLVVAGFAASPWLFLACGNTATSADEPASGRSGICDSICERADECGLESVDECLRACRDDDVSSSAALQVVEICAGDVTCNGFENGDLAECVTEGIADLATSSAAEEYCDELRAWATDCLETVPTASECYAVANAASSGYLAELGDCLEADCAETADCVTSVQSQYDAGDSIIQLVADGFGGSTDPACCSSGDPCSWANDGECDCSGEYSWDAVDCSDPTGCSFANDGECDEPNLCPTGTDTADCSTQNCCVAGDPCGWANDDICDCSGTYSWDANDCSAGCPYTNDGECDEPNLCPTGTDTVDCSTCPYTNDGECDEPNLCPAGTDTVDCSTCPYTNDGECDEPNLCPTGTDTVDCSTCPYTNDGECDEPNLCPAGTDTADCTGTAGDTCVYANDGACNEPSFCAYGTDASDCAGTCCSAEDPCGYANDSYCDCDGTFSWDAADCGQ
jgi:hypothetical protein